MAYCRQPVRQVPVIEVDAGRPVEFVLNRGAALKRAENVGRSDDTTVVVIEPAG